MIYLIKLAMLVVADDPKNDSVIPVLKIGYSSDDRQKPRFSDYIAAGHRIRIIKTIPGGSERLEHLLQRLFRDYRVPKRSQEWFFNRQEIVDMFMSCNTAEDLTRFVLEQGGDAIDDKKHIHKARVEKDLMDEIDVDGLSEEHIDNLKSILHHVYSNLSAFTDRAKYLCTEVVESDINLLASVLPVDFINFYQTLGPSIITRNSYQRSKLVNEFNRIEKNQSVEVLVKEAVLRSFLVGHRYTSNRIKNDLKNIYEMFDYKVAPKATNLKEYFELKDVLISMPDGKMSRGFEILSVKQ